MPLPAAPPAAWVPAKPPADISENTYNDRAGVISRPVFAAWKKDTGKTRVLFGYVVVCYQLSSTTN